MNLFNFFKNLFTGSKQKPSALNVERKPSGKELRDAGIKQALDHANSCSPKWSENAYNFLLHYSTMHPEFMIEDLRQASVGVVPEPPTTKAWGGIAVRAARAGVIKKKEVRNTKGAAGHCHPATLWEVVK